MSITFQVPLSEVEAEIKQDCRDAIARCRANEKQQIHDSREGAKMLARLSLVWPSEIELNVTRWGYVEPHCTVPRESLPMLRRAIGRLHMKDKQLVGKPETPELLVSLTVEGFPGLTIQYRRPFFPGPDCRCKIEEQTSTYRTLVCSR